MCELSYINTGSKALDVAITYALGFVDGVSNGDGVGIYCNGRVWKSHFGGASLTNLAPNVKATVTGKHGVFLHTRAAGMSMNNVKSVCDANSHPFIGSRFILMHNGTLTYRELLSKEVKDKLGAMTDSEFFLQKLEENAAEPDFAKALNDTMSKFYGKFAFLIEDNLTQTMYAVRGNSALLHKVDILDAEGKVMGIVINTQKNDIIRALVLASNICSVFFDFDPDKIEELKKETIFELNRTGVKEVAACKENFYTAATAATSNAASTGTTYNQRTSGNAHAALPAQTSGTTTTTKLGKHKFLRRMTEIGVTIEHVDVFVRKIMGKGMLSLTQEDWMRLDTEGLAIVEKKATTEVKELWKQIRGYTYGLDSLPYRSGIITFPFFLEDIECLRYTVTKLKKEESIHASKIEAARIVFAISEVQPTECASVARCD